MKRTVDFYSPEYKRSRAAYMAQSTFEYFVSLLATGAFLAKLLTSLGISDALAGVIASFSSLVFVCQLFSILLVKGRLGAKALSIIFETVSQVCFALMYFIPFFSLEKAAKHALVIIFIIIGYIAKYLVFSILFGWGNSFFDPEKRGIFSARREMISLIAGIVFTLTVSRTFDSMEAAGNIKGSFAFVAILMLASALLSLVCMLLMCPTEKAAQTAQKKPLSDVMKNTVGNAAFRRILIFTMIFNSAGSFTLGFLGVYKTNDLLLSLFVIELINMAGNLCRFGVSSPLGKFSDKTSFAKGIELGTAMLAIAFFFCMFTTPRTWFLIILFTIIYNASLAGTNQNSFNIIYSYVNTEYITQAMAIQSCTKGICGFIAALIGGEILAAVQANENKVFGFSVYGQQLLACISFIGIVIALLYLHFAIVRHEHGEYEK